MVVGMMIGRDCRGMAWVGSACACADLEGREAVSGGDGRREALEGGADEARIEARDSDVEVLRVRELAARRAEVDEEHHVEEHGDAEGRHGDFDDERGACFGGRGRGR